MTRTVVFDSEKKFDRIYAGVTVGATIAAAQYNKENNGRPLPFDKQRALARVIRKLKSISHQPDEKNLDRKLNIIADNRPIAVELTLDQPEHDLIIQLYEKVDWNPALMDEVVDTLDWFSAADKQE